jgi:alpha-tubulin suppressor-like RCC1 family protein
MVCAAVAGLAVIAAAMPALAVQRPGGTAASRARAGTTGRRTATGRMSPGPSWAHIAAGSNHTCGIRTGGTLWCWGDNEYGELGTGNHTGQDWPRQVTTPARGGWASVTAGYDYTCAIRTDATLWCWGYNSDGELGTGNHTSQDRPQQVTTPAAGGWASITAGDIHACATRTDATLWCWGYNGNGELGTGNHTSQDRPQQVTAPAAGGWTGVTTGSADSCAIRTGGTLWCWGDNTYGELGTGNHTSQDRPHQVTTPAAGGWASLTAGYGHICATRTNSTLWCWGFDDFGQLGTGNGSDQNRPRQVTTPTPGG